MTKDEELIKAVNEMKKEIHEMRVCLTGDRLSKPPVVGVLDILNTHKNELYGDQGTQHEGLKERIATDEARITKLEDERKKVYGICGGVTLLLAAYEIYARLFH